MCLRTYNENARGKRRVRCYAARVLAQVASVPELATALPRVAAVAHTGSATALNPSVFNSRARPELRLDLLAVGRTAAFHGDARGWFARALQSCRALLVEVEPALRAELLASFDGAVLGAGEKRLLLRGALRFPLIRIDDYPSGVRPIPADLTPIHDVLMQFETRSVPYTLGIVPGILNDRMLDFLGSLRCMLPAQHGFDHRYAKYSARLIARGDPWNQRGTVGAFNEFRFATYGTVVSKLRAGKELLERRLRKPVSTYIPPCNVCDRTTSKALQRLGFELCLCDKPVASRRVPVLGSDFYGRSADAKLDARMETLCLHTNWEWDVARAGNAQALSTWIERVVELTNAKQRAIELLAERVRSNLI
jgi:hypothetical protein